MDVLHLYASEFLKPLTYTQFLYKIIKSKFGLNSMLWFVNISYTPCLKLVIILYTFIPSKHLYKTIRYG